MVVISRAKEAPERGYAQTVFMRLTFGAPPSSQATVTGPSCVVAQHRQGLSRVTANCSMESMSGSSLPSMGEGRSTISARALMVLFVLLYDNRVDRYPFIPVTDND